MAKSVTYVISPKIQEKRRHKCESIMHKFTESRKELCRYSQVENVNVPAVERDKILFCTKSTYEGCWNLLDMNGWGTYTFPTGTQYQGRVAEGVFQGRGEMIFPSGEEIRGKWVNGEFTGGEYFFYNGLKYETEKWTYCRMPDRRFFIEVTDHLKPVDITNKTAEQPTRKIPDGYYDTGDGYYDPLTKVVYKYEELSEIIRSPLDEEQKWIVDNCRKAPEEPVGPVPELYEAFYQPSKYIDQESSQSDLDWLTACDDEFLVRFASMRRKSSRFSYGDERMLLNTRFNAEDVGTINLSPSESVTTSAGRRFSAISTLSASDRLNKIHENRPKLFI